MAETVGAMLIAEGRVLLGLRAAHKSFAGCWDIIGGHVEPGETEWSALQRELSEELGIECDDGRRLGALTLLDAEGRSSVVHVYSVRSWIGEPAMQNDEHSKIQWFTPEEAENLPNLASVQYRSMFASFREPLPPKNHSYSA